MFVLALQLICNCYYWGFVKSLCQTFDVGDIILHMSGKLFTERFNELNFY